MLIITGIFIAAYLAIAFEHPLRINKTASALLGAALCWALYALLAGNSHEVLHHLMENLAESSGIIFFLMGAMTIVEIIDLHGGFSIVTEHIRTKNLRKMLWIVSWITFFLSAALDNLTTTIVMISLIRKILNKREDRLIFAGMIVIAANAGGAWSPIGDVTTTMLWIGRRISAVGIVSGLILPSIVNLLIPLIVLTIGIKGSVEKVETKIAEHGTEVHAWEKMLIFCIGVGSLLFVPVFKTITHLPPWMGILFGLGLMWIITEIIHRNKHESHAGNLNAVHALRRIDMSSVLFFLGILLAVGSLQSIGQLKAVAVLLDSTIGNLSGIVLSIGILSSIVDNVPLVAASMGMYSVQSYPTDHFIWEFLAYCAGTGGSILVIGSAAGVAAMGLEKITFGWYLKRIGPLALLGYFAGAGVYLLYHYL
jgi:Na+/H+ antiporter NhaD/arsenite permease-like protein